MKIWGVAAIFAVLALPVLAQELTPDAVRAMLQAQDATEVVQTLDTGETTTPWDAVLAHIEAGQEDWMALVPLLAPGTDAGTAEGLTITLSRALRTNAAGVLTLLADGLYRAEDICTDNEIEVPVSQIVEFVDVALVAVAAILDPALMSARNDCLSELGATRVSTLVQPQ